MDKEHQQKKDFCDWLNKQINNPEKQIIGDVQIPIYNSLLKKSNFILIANFV